MKAWRRYAFGDCRLEEEPMPVAKPGWCLIKIRVAQASVTDAQRAMGLPHRGHRADKGLIEKYAPIKLFGHELCGEIVELGGGRQEIQVGDRGRGDEHGAVP